MGPQSSGISVSLQSCDHDCPPSLPASCKQTQWGNQLEVGNHGWMRSLLNNLNSPLIMVIKTAIVNQLGHMIFHFMADFFFCFTTILFSLLWCHNVSLILLVYFVNHFDMETQRLCMLRHTKLRREKGKSFDQLIFVGIKIQCELFNFSYNYASWLYCPVTEFH